MLSAVTPAMIECVPHELLPIIPPSVQRLCVAGSGPKVSSCSSAASRSRSSTSPGCTRANRRSGSSSTIALHVLGEVEQHGLVDRLARQAGAAAAGERSARRARRQTSTVAITSSRRAG